MILRFTREKLLAALFLPVFLNACAAFETGEAKLDRIKTVAIVSAVGDEFNFTRTGLSGIADADRRFPIDAWALDDVITKQAAASMGARFEVQPVNLDRASFYALSRNESPIRPVNLMREDPVKALLRAYSSPQSPDAYVVIVKARSPIGPSGRSVEGIGAVSVSAVFGSYDQIHALYEVRVYDGHTVELLEERPAAPLDNADVRRLAGPSRVVDATYMPGAGDPAGNEKLRGAITDLVARSLPPTLRDLHLTDNH